MFFSQRCSIPPYSQHVTRVSRHTTQIYSSLEQKQWENMLCFVCFPFSPCLDGRREEVEEVGIPEVAL